MFLLSHVQNAYTIKERKGAELEAAQDYSPDHIVLGKSLHLTLRSIKTQGDYLNVFFLVSYSFFAV